MSDYFDLPSLERVRGCYGRVGEVLDEVEAIARGHMGGPEIQKPYQDGIARLMKAARDLVECVSRHLPQAR
jgi:hypothetical protein